MEPKEMTELRELSKPLIEWLQTNYDPYTKIVIEDNRVSLEHRTMSFPVEVKD